MVLAQAGGDIGRNPQLTLPEGPGINIWNYYSIMKVTPIIMENFLLVVLTIPLADQSLVMNLYRVHNLLTLHPKLHYNLSTDWRVNIWPSQKINNMLPSPLLETYEYVRPLKGVSVP